VASKSFDNTAYSFFYVTLDCVGCVARETNRLCYWT